MSWLILNSALFAFSVLSGMLGIGVAFAAVPLLSVFMPDLVNDVFPLSLTLNGVTALFSLLGFARAGMVRWRAAAILSLPTTIAAPLGALLARSTPELALWIVYFLATAALLYETLIAKVKQSDQTRFSLACWLAVPVAFVSGLIGVGPGFMLVPVLVKCGTSFKEAAALNAFAVVPSSFAAAAIHAGHSSLSPAEVVPLLIFSAVGSLLGAVLATRHLPAATLRRILGCTILAVAAYKVVQLLVGAGA